MRWSRWPSWARPWRAARFAGSGTSRSPSTKRRVLIFNATVGGKPSLLLHLHGRIPIQASYVLPMTIRHQAKGEFGTVLATRVPKLAGGSGLITSLRLELGREYRYRGNAGPT